MFTRNNTSQIQSSLITLLLFFLLAPVSLRSAERSSINVFVLHSYSQEYPWTKLQNDGFVSTLIEKSKPNYLSFSTEYLDTKRVQFSPEYQVFFRDYLRKKYDSYRPDIIFSTDDNALQFLLKHKTVIFPETPVVFCGVNDTSIIDIIDNGRYTGIFEVKDIKSNITLINQLFPAAENILVIGDNSSTYKAIKKDINLYRETTQLPTPIEFIADKNFEVIKEKLKSKGKGIVLLTTIGSFLGEEKQTVKLQQAISSIQKTGTFTIISMEDVYILDGVFGGIVTSGTSQGSAAADIASNYLFKGESISTSNPSTGNNIPIFNYIDTKLRGVHPSKLPEGSVLLNKPKTIYEEHKAVFWTSSMVFCFLLILLMILSINIISRKKAESALADSEHFLDSIIENIPDIIFVKKADNLRFVRLNRAGEEIFGITPSDIVGKDDYDIFTKEEADFFTRNDKEVLAKRQLVNIPEESVKTHSGTRYLHTKKIPILDQQGNPSYLLGISRDITQEKEENEKRKELEERLQQAEKMESLGLLAGGVAHDLNNVLSGVISYPELILLDLPENDPNRKKIQTIRDSGRKAAEIVEDLLTLARRSVVTAQLVNLNDLLEEYRNSPEHQKLLSYYPDVNISMNRENHLPNIYGSAIHLKKVIMNLVSNAAEAQPRGGEIHISTASCCLLEEKIGFQKIAAGEYVIISVKDTGKGIPSPDLKRIFEPFFTKKVTGRSGTGLGLTVVWGAISDHNGFIDIKSGLQQGTTIDLYFPSTHDITTSENSREIAKTFLGNQESVLVVDDVAHQRDITADILTRLNYAVTTVSSGEEAVDYLKNHSANLVILDMIMGSGMDGLDTFRKIKAFKPKQKVIIASGYAETDRVRQAQKLGAGGYIQKPYSLEELGLAAHMELRS